MSAPRTTVRFTPDGPLIVEGLERLEGPAGPLECAPRMALCRCGGSRSKPFCDGAHAKNGFSSARSGERLPDRVDDHVGARVTIHDNRSICAHAGRCTDGLPLVWRLGQEPWIDPDGADPEAILEVARSCPSGALRATLSSPEGAQESPSSDELAHGEPDACVVHVAPGGPYAVAGTVDLADQPLARGADPRRVTLCRCGCSRNKPFCDGTHWTVDFDGARP